MQIKTISLVSLLLMGVLTVFAGNKTEKFEVKGNCGMCETRIEDAAKSVDGVSKAEWDKTTKQIELTFDDSKTDIHKIQMAIAKVGHDTGMHKAEDEVYNKLPGCCKYDRTVDEDTSHDGHKH